MMCMRLPEDVSIFLRSSWLLGSFLVRPLLGTAFSSHMLRLLDAGHGRAGFVFARSVYFVHECWNIPTKRAHKKLHKPEISPNDHFQAHIPVQQTAMMCTIARLRLCIMHCHKPPAGRAADKRPGEMAETLRPSEATHAKAACGFASRALSFYICLPKMLGFVVRPLKPEITGAEPPTSLFHNVENTCFAIVSPPLSGELRDGQGRGVGERQMGFFDSSAMGLRSTH